MVFGTESVLRRRRSFGFGELSHWGLFFSGEEESSFDGCKVGPTARERAQQAGMRADTQGTVCRNGGVPRCVRVRRMNWMRAGMLYYP